MSARPRIRWWWLLGLVLAAGAAFVFVAALMLIGVVLFVGWPGDVP